MLCCYVLLLFMMMLPIEGSQKPKEEFQEVENFEHQIAYIIYKFYSTPKSNEVPTVFMADKLTDDCDVFCVLQKYDGTVYFQQFLGWMRPEFTPLIAQIGHTLDGIFSLNKTDMKKQLKNPLIKKLFRSIETSMTKGLYGKSKLVFATRVHAPKIQLPTEILWTLYDNLLFFVRFPPRNRKEWLGWVDTWCELESTKLLEYMEEHNTLENLEMTSKPYYTSLELFLYYVGQVFAHMVWETHMCAGARAARIEDVAENEQFIDLNRRRVKLFEGVRKMLIKWYRTVKAEQEDHIYMVYDDDDRHDRLEPVTMRGLDYFYCHGREMVGKDHTFPSPPCRYLKPGRCEPLNFPKNDNMLYYHIYYARVENRKPNMTCIDFYPPSKFGSFCDRCMMVVKKIDKKENAYVHVNRLDTHFSIVEIPAFYHWEEIFPPAEYNPDLIKQHYRILQKIQDCFYYSKNFTIVSEPVQNESIFNYYAFENMFKNTTKVVCDLPTTTTTTTTTTKTTTNSTPTTTTTTTVATTKEELKGFTNGLVLMFGFMTFFMFIVVY